jgi:hypothetical protein
MARVSGWCQAPPGFRPKCEGCRAEICDHDCHNKTKEAA